MSLFSDVFPEPSSLTNKLPTSDFLAYDRSADFLPHNFKKTSRLPGFYKKSIRERWQVVVDRIHFSIEELKLSLEDGYSQDHEEFVERSIENALGGFIFPLGIATNFRINHKDVLVPMCTEEPSIVAAASYGAKLARSVSGFITSASPPITTAQVELRCSDPSHLVSWQNILREGGKEKLMEAGRGFMVSMEKRGGGLKDITWKVIPELAVLVLYFHVDTVDAMGANAVNSLVDALKQKTLGEFFPGVDVGLCIITNFSLGSMVEARCEVKWSALGSSKKQSLKLMHNIEKASLLAEKDVFRAVTHNKGIMNGVDGVAVATGNDFRALEAGAHSYAAYGGTYKPLSRWRRHEKTNTLQGILRMPLSVGTVGGMTKFHPLASIMLKLLGKPRATELAQIMAAVGLGQNLAALRALADEGIQQGHMKLHHLRTSRASL